MLVDDLFVLGLRGTQKINKWREDLARSSLEKVSSREGFGVRWTRLLLGSHALLDFFGFLRREEVVTALYFVCERANSRISQSGIRWRDDTTTKTYNERNALCLYKIGTMPTRFLSNMNVSQPNTSAPPEKNGLRSTRRGRTWRADVRGASAQRSPLSLFDHHQKSFAESAFGPEEECRHSLFRRKKRDANAGAAPRPRTADVPKNTLDPWPPGKFLRIVQNI